MAQRSNGCKSIYACGGAKQSHCPEPETQGPAGVDRVVLKPFHATMDDCCKIVKMLEKSKSR